MTIGKFKDLSPSADPSPSLDAEDPCFERRTSPGNISSDLCTVKDVLPFFPNPILRLRPKYVFYYFKDIIFQNYIKSFMKVIPK